MLHIKKLSLEDVHKTNNQSPQDLLNFRVLDYLIGHQSSYQNSHNLPVK